MIFSKDKKPTEPGWYWAFLQWRDQPEQAEPVAVTRGFQNRLMVCFEGHTYQVAGLDEILYGDRIEVPPVDQKEGG
jgi:hypothetical protein